MRNSMILLAALLATSRVCMPVRGGESEHEARIKEMRKNVGDLVASGKNAESAKFRPDALLRYSDPVRKIVDATMWSLGTKGRPQGILVLELYDRGTKFWSYELTVTSNNVTETLKGPTWTWKPSGKEFVWTEFPSTPEPAATKIMRGRQMKKIAHMLNASEQWDGQTYKLRLMPRPILRYQDEAAGILDGNIFVLAHGTNAELLVLIEAQSDKRTGKASWQAGFARLGAARFDVAYGGSPLWKAGYQFRSSRDYFNGQTQIVQDGG